MVAKNKSRRLPDSYFLLVEQFPLTHLKNENDLQKAQKVLDQLLEESLDSGGLEYLNALTDLVEIYETEHVVLADVSESEVLAELMRANGLSQAKLARDVGISQSTLSAVIRGNRSLTKDQMVALAKFFNISPLAFLPNSGCN